jgi:hypothetical protein
MIDGQSATQPRGYNWGAAWKKNVAAQVQKTENTAVGIRHADHVAPSIRKKLALTSPTSGGDSVGVLSFCMMQMNL